MPLEEATLADVLEFVADGTTPAVRRQRSRSCRAFYRWAHSEGVMEAGWWQRVPSLNEPAAPQRTVTVDDVTTTLGAIHGQTFTAARDRALIAVLWSSGLRRSEVARMRVGDLEQRCLMVISAKGGKPRLARSAPRRRATSCGTSVTALFIRTPPALPSGSVSAVRWPTRASGRCLNAAALPALMPFAAAGAWTAFALASAKHRFRRQPDGPVRPRSAGTRRRCATS
jgi:hypothetical protein